MPVDAHDGNKNPSVLALVAPSGSGKDALTKKLCQEDRFVNPKTYCTKKSSKHHYLTKEQFAQQDFFERTMYAGVHYGTKRKISRRCLTMASMPSCPWICVAQLP